MGYAGRPRRQIFEKCHKQCRRISMAWHHYPFLKEDALCRKMKRGCKKALLQHKRRRHDFNCVPTLLFLWQSFSSSSGSTDSRKIELENVKTWAQEAKSMREQTLSCAFLKRIYYYYYEASLYLRLLHLLFSVVSSKKRKIKTRARGEHKGNFQYHLQAQ